MAQSLHIGLFLDPLLTYLLVSASHLFWPCQVHLFSFTFGAFKSCDSPISKISEPPHLQKSQHTCQMVRKQIQKPFKWHVDMMIYGIYKHLIYLIFVSWLRSNVLWFTWILPTLTLIYMSICKICISLGPTDAIQTKINPTKTLHLHGLRTCCLKTPSVSQHPNVGPGVFGKNQVQISIKLPYLKLTVRTWKWMAGRWVSFWV